MCSVIGAIILIIIIASISSSDLENKAYGATKKELSSFKDSSSVKIQEIQICGHYAKLADKTSTLLYVDVPFTFPQYILKHFYGKIIMLIPSKKEIMELVFNEIRKFNKDNILIVANNIDGIKEQVEDGIDGLLVDLDDIPKSAEKIYKFYNSKDMKIINKKAQLRLRRDYSYVKNCRVFLQRLVG